ncbi:MAG: hypothetical protein RBT15_07260 [Gudongella sp.]|nr:hypothetical protein [Gudongella sp.]
MDGIIFEQDPESLAAVCIIEYFSDALKDQIRQNLTSVCQGVSRGESGKTVYSYANTLKEFMVRYDDKKEEHRKGMIGELLAHIIFINYFDYFKTVSPLFNLEERNIKKGFDVLLYHATDREIFYAEVKSGELGNNKSSDDKNIKLLGNALSDIRDKFNKPNDNNWINSLNGAIIALNNKNIKKEVENILEDCLQTSQEKKCQSIDKNAILVSVAYNTLSDKISLSRVNKYSGKVKNRNLLKNIICFSIQKKAYKQAEDFLRQEARNG